MNEHPSDTESRAATLLQAFDDRRQIAPLSDTAPVSLASAYAIAADIAARRQARGETPIGRKIGFTNRTIWPIYGVEAPIWGWMYDTTVHDIPDGGRIPLQGLPEPRIEPEIAFAFTETLVPEMSVADIAARLDWVAHGVEIVMSVYPGWKFTAPDAVAAMGMHGGCWLGERRPADEILNGDPARLEAFSLTLEGPDERHTGHARDVLDGPLHAVKHLLDVIDRMPGAGPVGPGEVLITGTLTDARLVAAGQRWLTQIDGIGLPGLDITFTA
ncbi:MAG: hypothetical protein QNJ44_14210 [Rhodobacter sp.]|nr:hypothetical protein [Rhodobacter sp.]